MRTLPRSSLPRAPTTRSSPQRPSTSSSPESLYTASPPRPCRPLAVGGNWRLRGMRGSGEAARREPCRSFEQPDAEAIHKRTRCVIKERSSPKGAELPRVREALVSFVRNSEIRLPLNVTDVVLLIWAGCEGYGRRGVGRLGSARGRTDPLGALRPLLTRGVRQGGKALGGPRLDEELVQDAFTSVWQAALTGTLAPAARRFSKGNSRTLKRLV